jgi:excisionase family DNA binding protein
VSSTTRPAGPRTRRPRTAADRVPAHPNTFGPEMGRAVSREQLTIAELCAELKISRSTFYDWRAKGRAPRCLRLPNGDLRIRRADLDTWLDTRTEGV